MNASPPVMPADWKSPEQRQRRISRVAFFIGLGCLAGCFWPSLAGWDMMDHGFGTIAILIFLIICAWVTAAVYWSRANRVRRLFSGEGLLAVWTYAPEHWRKFLTEDYAIESADKRHLFYIVAGFALVIGGGFWLFDHEAGGIVFLVLLGVVAIIAFVAIVAPKIKYRHQLKHQEPVCIGRAGAWVGGFYHDWSMLGARLESCGVNTEEEVPFLGITYSFPTRGGRDEATARIPIPPGKEDEALAVVQALGHTRKK